MDNKQLLEEELKRHMNIVEYTLEGQLIDEEGDEGDDFDFGNEEPNTDGDVKDDEGGDDLGFDDESINLDDEGGEDLDFGTTEPIEAPVEDEVEIDITQLISDIDQNKNVANNANTKMDSLMTQFSQLQNSLKTMDGISQKITDMEADMDKRMPTPEDKLEMRSFDSYPYNLKLTDYWSDQDGKYDVLSDENQEEEEYVLTQQDVNDEYSENTVGKSFDEYEEDTVTY